MSEDLPDLEPIDLTTPPNRCRAIVPAWAPGWYADPWTAGQYRYWSGQTWTGETNRWGPSTADAAAGARARPTDPWPSLSAPAASGYGWPAATARRSRARRRRAASSVAGASIVGIALAVVVVLLSGAIGFAIESSSHSNPQSQANPLPFDSRRHDESRLPPTVPGAGVSHDPNRRALSRIVVQQSDVDSSRRGPVDPDGQPAHGADARSLQRHVPERAPPHRSVAGRRRRCEHRQPHVTEHRGRAVPQRGRIGAGVRGAAQGQRVVPASRRW